MDLRRPRFELGSAQNSILQEDIDHTIRNMPRREKGNCFEILIIRLTAVLFIKIFEHILMLLGFTFSMPNYHNI